MRTPIRSCLVLILAASAAPLWANPGTAPSSVDEPAALAIMALGVVGLVIGRRMAQRRD